MYFLILILNLIFYNRVMCWKEASKCTIGTNSPDQIYLDSQVNNEKVLQLDCNKDLIFIAWTHYGYQTASNQPAKQQSFNSNNNNKTDNCYFSPKDCIVSVDYVANECNGLSTCQVSLDAQYLHSCKSYSNYLFIVYECIQAKTTVNICDENLDTQIKNDLIYLQTPNYPSEYFSNLDCNCSMKTQRDTTIQFELLEFDLESSIISNDNSNNNINNHNDASILSSKIIKPLNQYQTSLTSSNQIINSFTCLRDYFTINSNTQLCGTLTPFTSLLSIPSNKPDFSITKKNYQLTSFRFTSDDALTRRGFWLKIKVASNQNQCPENFILINNVCLRIYDEMLTWYEAHTYCLSLGYSLALIDNFELEKQLNKVVFNEEDDSVMDSLILYNSANRFKSKVNLVKKFWIGIRQLNQTNWFDYKNEVIRFREDEKNWWPWLIVDSSTYNQGSCVAKRKNSFFLEDCYKRMAFACEYKRPQSTKQPDANSKIHLKCGKDHDKFTDNDQNNSKLTVAKTAQTTTAIKQTVFSSSSYSLNKTQLANSFQIESTQNSTSIIQIKNEINSDSNLNENNFRLPVKTTSRDNSTDSTLLIGLIFVITLLIASINTVVIIFICKRRKYLLKQQNNENTDKDSKISQDTINSSQNINLDDGNLTMSGMNTSLSYNCLSNINQATLFLNNSTNNNEAYNFLTNFSNCNNLRRSVFITNCDQNRQLNPNVSTLASNKTSSFMHNTNKLNSQNQILTQGNAKSSNNQMLNDPLGHIYETISVSSASNGNMPIYNPRLSHNNNHNLLLNQLDAANKNAYNEIDCEFQRSTIHANIDSNDLSLTDSSSASQKSQELFLINLNNSKKNSKTLQQFNRLNMNNNNNNSKNIQINNNNINQQYLTQFRYSGRNIIPDMSISTTTNTSPSCSSSGTTTTSADLQPTLLSNRSNINEFSQHRNLNNQRHQLQLIQNHQAQQQNFSILNLSTDHQQFNNLNRHDINCNSISNVHNNNNNNLNLVNNHNHNFLHFNQFNNQNNNVHKTDPADTNHLFSSRMEAVV